jgi:outer membrane protein OmpA-like peptidoglycan-associated protein
MNTSNINQPRFPRMLAVAIAAASLAVASCATTPESPQGSAEVRSKLSALQSNSTLADQAPVEIREAEAAVLIAEQPVGRDVALGEHRVYMADRKVEIASAKASTRNAEIERIALSQARDEARLDARTREADKAHRETAAAQTETAAAQTETDAAHALAVVVAAGVASDAADAATEAEELQRQIDELQAEATDRGLVLTLGNVLFATGGSDLNSGETAPLDKLVVFLNDYPDRTVVVEGHTDDVGSDEMNQALSQRRADSVTSYLKQQGIQSQRLIASGMGETNPIADNLSESGRQQNRRVEVIIANPPSAIPAASTN